MAMGSVIAIISNIFQIILIFQREVDGVLVVGDAVGAAKIAQAGNDDTMFTNNPAGVFGGDLEGDRIVVDSNNQLIGVGKQRLDKKN